MLPWAWFLRLQSLPAADGIYQWVDCGLWLLRSVVLWCVCTKSRSRHQTILPPVSGLLSWQEEEMWVGLHLGPGLPWERQTWLSGSVNADYCRIPCGWLSRTAHQDGLAFDLLGRATRPHAFCGSRSSGCTRLQSTPQAPQLASLSLLQSEMKSLEGAGRRKNN